MYQRKNRYSKTASKSATNGYLKASNRYYKATKRKSGCSTNSLNRKKDS